MADLGGTVRRLTAAIARVRAGPFDLGPDDYEAWTVDTSPAHRALVSQIGGYLAVVLGLYVAIVILVSDDGAASHRFGVAVGAGAILTGLVLARHARSVPVWVDDLLAVVASVMLAVAGRRGGAFSVALPGVYVCLGIVLFAIRRWQVAVLHLCHFAVSYAVVVSTTAGYEAPLTWWVGVMAAVMTSAGFVRWLVQNVGVLVVAEHDAREMAEETSARLAAVSRAKSEFLARMSHELRTPLNAVLGFADVLRDQLVGPLNERQSAYVDDIADSGRHLLALVDEVLDLGKVESGSVVLDVAPVDIGRTLEDARMLVRERSRKSGIRVTVVVERGVPVVEADARKVRQVVTNLLANAVKFTPRNGRVTVTASPAPGGGVRVAVADTGVGIAPDDIERIFEQFEQVAGVSGAASEGTGLGLAVARRFVDRHGGRLWAQSAPGRGSTFVFELPARPPRGVTSTRPRGAAAPPVEHPIDAYEGFLVPGSRRNRELIAGTGRAFAVIAAALTIVFAVITPGAGHARVVVGAVAFLALLFGVLVGRFGSSASVLALESLPVLGTLAISALAWLAAPFAGLISMAYVWTTLTRFALWDRGRAVLQIVLTAACFGIVLAGHPELGDRPARWLGLLFLLVVNGLLARWIILKLRSVAMAERDARLTAEQVQAQLAATSEHKSDFLASMSHELRTPLNAIIGFSDVLREGVAGPLDERQTAYVDDIADAGRHLLALINDILDLAKLEAGQLQLQREPVAVSSLVEHAVVRARPGALEREVTLRSTCPPDAVIDADAARLEQVLASVVDNAVKFTADGGAVDVRVEAHGDEVRIAVSDTGIGIHPANRRSIFDAFHVAAREGTGLGLALAKGLVELHGGRIWVESEPGVGSTFTVAMAARHLVDAS